MLRIQDVDFMSGIGADDAVPLQIAQGLVERHPMHAEQACEFLLIEFGDNAPVHSAVRQHGGLQAQKAAYAYGQFPHAQGDGLIGKKTRLARQRAQEAQSDVGVLRHQHLVNALLAEAIQHARLAGGNAAQVRHAVKKRNFADDGPRTDTHQPLFPSVEHGPEQPEFPLLHDIKRVADASSGDDNRALGNVEPFAEMIGLPPDSGRIPRHGKKFVKKHVAAGTRRIELVVSKAAFEFMNAKVREMDKLSLMFKAHFDEVVERVEKLAEDNKELSKKIEKLEEENARAKFATFASKAQDIEGGKLFISKIEDITPLGAKIGLEFLSNKFGESIIVLANSKTVLAKVSDGFVKKGINAGKIVGEIAKATGANGGGRPNFAQGGIKDATKLDEILSKIEKDLTTSKIEA